jgi:hypothetical protein
MAGAFKRGDPNMSEQLVLMRALRDMNLPKFIFEDVPLFLGLINDLFPGMDCPRVRYPQLNDVVENDLEVCMVSIYITLHTKPWYSFSCLFQANYLEVELII